MFDSLPALTGTFLMNVLATVVIFIVGWIVVKALCNLFSKVLGKSEKLDPTVSHLLVTVLKFILLFVLLTTCAGRLGIPTTSLVTVLGTVGLAFSLALQNSLGNLAGGIFILVTKPFKAGDYISAAGNEGIVQKVGLVHTLLHTVDNRAVYIPNSSVMGGNVVNFSQTTRLVDLDIPVPYDCDLEKAKTVIEDVAKADPMVISDPFVRVWELTPSMIIKIRAEVKGGDYWEARSALVEHIKVALDKNGMSVPFSRVNVQLLDKKN